MQTWRPVPGPFDTPRDLEDFEPFPSIPEAPEDQLDHWLNALRVQPISAVEWDWADGTTSESSEDCAPYEAGKSTIPRRFSAEHTFRQGGQYDVAFRLKQKKKVVGLGKTVVRVRTGLSEEDFD